MMVYSTGDIVECVDGIWADLVLGTEVRSTICGTAFGSELS